MWKLSLPSALASDSSSIISASSTGTCSSGVDAVR